jgi:hypothetical protein
MNDNKSLGIQQRIPLDVLCEALKMELSDGFDEVLLGELLKTEYNGENRIRKSIYQIHSAVCSTALTPLLREHASDVLTALNSAADRHLILMAVIHARYSFCYDVASLIASQLRLQDTISSELLNRLIGQKYGMNKSTENSRNCAVPQLIEAKMMSRVKTGLYASTEPQEPRFDISRAIWKESFFINNPLYNRLDSETMLFEPYFRYIKSEFVINV